MLPDAEITFNELAEWYLGKRKVKKLTSFPRIRTCINHFIDVFGSTVVGDIRLDDLEDYQEMREEAGMAPATIDLEVQMAAQMVRNAWDNDRVSDTPVKAFRRLKNKLRFGQNARKRYITLEEYQALCESAAPHVRAQVIAIYNTGMRPGEIRALRYEYLDKKAGFFRLPAEITKENRAKDIPINRHLAALLKSLPRSLHHDFVFTYNGQPLVRTIRIGLRNACRNAGLPYGRKEKGGITLHDFRGTFKTNLRKAGVNKAVRDAMVGHAQQGMDRHYDTVDDQDLLEGMGQFEAWFDNEAEKASKALPKVSGQRLNT